MNLSKQTSLSKKSFINEIKNVSVSEGFQEKKNLSVEVNDISIKEI